MKLLMITRKVDRNDHLAGFIYNWVKHLAAKVEHLYVISWQQGDAAGLPDNVTVVHLPTKQNKLVKLARLKLLAWKYLGKVDGAFCHQMPIYTIVVGPLARLRGKKVVSWYTHKQVDLKMKLMEKIAHVVLTASKESFLLPSKKVVVTGHGIDTNLFAFKQSRSNEKLEIISIGRISPSKNYEAMIEAAKALKEKQIDFVFKIYGDAGTSEQKHYMQQVITKVSEYNLDSQVMFCGPKPNSEVPQLLQQADVFVNMSNTGSLDKAVLEAMACGCLPLTSNIAFKDILPAELFVNSQLADSIEKLYRLTLSEKQKLQKLLREEVEQKHSLDTLAVKIVQRYE